MLSKPQIRTITSLQHKKFRKESGLFIVEGAKSLTEFIHSDYIVQHIFYTPHAVTKLGKIPENIKSEPISEQELKRISALKNPQDTLGLVQIPVYPPLLDDDLKRGFHLVLDNIQDPGNLGTIIRTAEWFGFSHIICSHDSVDAYNPKVVQATMGSLARVKLYYTDIEKLTAYSPVPVFGAVLDGTSLYRTEFGDAGLIILGNEGNGIRASVSAHIRNRVTIPRIGGAESLNVAISTALFCAELARKG